ncbi:MAG: hypothetical protein ACFHWX_04275 [Bacteroidota bacterium]
MEDQNASSAFKIIKTIHWALVAGISLFASVVAFLLGTNTETTFIRSEEVIVFMPVFLAIFMLPTAVMLSNRQMNVLKEKSDLGQKIAGFQTAHIVKMAMLEGVGLFAIVVCFITYTTINFFVFGLVIILMAGSAPTAFKLSEKLGLSRDELETLGG